MEEGSGPTTETECSLSLADITSPSQLQEVTLEHDGTFSNTTMGVRSPGGPMRGRSVKEFEEQLTNLKKENFNLKLRIYFLEEKMGTTFTLDRDNIVKKYIELQVDYENLRKEMEEKQELLCQAVKAIELEDEEHKKYVIDKEDQLNTCQQEIEDLRIQLQDMKYDSEAVSIKSDTTGFYSSKLSGSVVNDLQDRVKTLENELHLEKETNASFQLLISQTETIKTRCDNMQREIQAKNEIIKNLNQENESVNARVQTYETQAKDFQDKLEISIKENQSINKKLILESKRFEELAGQYQELKKKYSNLKVDIEREHKKAERTKIAGEAQINDLEEENGKLKNKLRETQAKLETALTEIRKNQNLAVSKSLSLKSNMSNTDIPYISVQDPTTPTGTPKKDPLHVQVVSVTSSTQNMTVRSNSSTSISSSPSSSDKFNSSDFEDIVAANTANDKILSLLYSFKNDYETQRQKLFKLKTEQFKACEIIKTMIDSRNKANEQIQQYQLQIKNLEKELESVVSKPTSDGEMAVSRDQVGAMANSEKSFEESKSEEVDKSELYKALTVELQNKIEILEATLKEKDVHLQKIRDQYDELLNNLEDREAKIAKLEYELVSSNCNVSLNKSTLEKGENASEKRSSFYKKEMEEKDKEIDRLNSELKKCSCYLQEIVNKELWDKNKEIEKLHSRQVNSPEILKLKKDLTGKELQLKVLKEKISELGLDLNISQDTDLKEFISPNKIQHIKIIQEELKACREERDYFMNKVLELKGTNQSDLIDKLTDQTDSLRTDLEKSEKLRRDANEVCTLLSLRLEELAIFLDSLLKQKSILGFLGIQKERKLREIINTSLDLSKSFNMSLIFNPDQSLVQLSNITSVLNGSAFKDLNITDLQDVDDSPEILSIVPGNITLTYQSHLYKQNKKSELDNEDVITALREQIVNLKSELQLRDNELNRLNANSKLSETEEEQKCKNLSGYAKELTTLYITPQKSNTTSTTLKYQSDCASESEGWSEPDRAVSRARIGLSQPQVAPVSPSAKSTHLSESTDDDNLSVSFLYSKHQEAELRQEICDLKFELNSKIVQLDASEEKLLNVITKDEFEEVKQNLLDAEGRVINLERLRFEAEEHNKALQEAVDSLTKSRDELSEAVVAKSEEIKKLCSLLEAEKTDSRKIAAKLEEIVEESNKNQVIFENKEKEFKELENRLRKDLQELTVKLEDGQMKFAEVKLMQENNELKIKEIEKEYLDKNRKLIQEIEALKELTLTYEQNVQIHKNKELKYENKITEHIEKIDSLNQEVDFVTLKYSEAVLDKTRLANEKTSLEQELSRYNVKEHELKQQMLEIHSEIGALTQNYQQEIVKLQSDKAELQMKISVLESNNAELHNRLVRIQAPRQNLSSSLPTMKIPSGAMYNRQYSQPSFSSEEHLEECSAYNVSAIMSRHRQPVDNERQEANASPDLGIESDQGRFSSLELHTSNISRPLLQTIELTESMSNMLDDDNNPLESDSCPSKQCCQKTLAISNENDDLKRKLLRMRRALEETANQLNLANQRKKEVEMTICKQIHKTSQVLRKAKANLDSGSEC